MRKFCDGAKAVYLAALPSSHLGHVLQQVSQTSPHLLTARQNLIRRQNKTVGTSVAKLDCHRVFRLGVLESIVNAVTTDLVDGVTDRAASEGGSMHSLDSSNSSFRQAGISGRIGQGTGASVAVRVHPKLGVRMDIHVELDTFACSKAIELSFQRFGLDTITSRGSLVVFITGRSAGSLSLAPGLMRPIPIDIPTDTAGRRSGLTILAPQAVAILREIEAIRVYDREDVEVVFILESGGCGIGRSQQLVCSILVNHSCNPFSCVYGAVPDHRLLRSLAATTPYMDALNVTTLKRLACGYNLRV